MNRILNLFHPHVLVLGGNLARPLADDGIDFVRAELNAIDPVAKSVRWTPDARPGSASETHRYDYRVVALGNRLVFDRSEGYARYSHSVPGAPLAPVVYCIGDMGSGQAFYIRSNSWFGGDTQVLKMGRVPHLLKMQYKTLFYERHGKVPAWGLDAAELFAEKVFA